MTSTAVFARCPKKAGYCVLMTLAVAAPVLAQPTRLEQVGVVPGPAEMVRVQGTRVYAALGRTLTVFDVTNPAAPRRIGAHTFPDKIGVSRKQAGWSTPLWTSTVSRSLTPRVRPGSRCAARSRRWARQRASPSSGRRPSSPITCPESTSSTSRTRRSRRRLGRSFWRDTRARWRPRDSIAAAVDAPTGLYLFDFTKAAKLEAVGTEQSAERPVLVDVTSTNGSSAPNVAVLVGSGTLQIYDISAPAAPRKVSTFRTPAGRPARVTLRNSLAYVADLVDGLVIVDLAEPASPRVVSTFKTPMPARDVAVGGGLILVAVARGGSSEVPPSEGHIIVLREK